MKIVVDTNILFSYFKKESFTRRLLSNPFFELISPEFSLSELKKYSAIIIRKCGLSVKEFEKEINQLKKEIQFISTKKYLYLLDEAKKISPDINDSEFFALCLKEKAILWSNDSLLKNQKRILVLSTEEIVRNFF